MNRVLNRRGQFIPMASMIMLSTLVFMIGMVNVYRISRAKLKAQNLADAVALYVASEMTQSMNNAADRNEWLNHMYSDAGDPTATQASHDPCRRTDPKTPPGLGCFAMQSGAGFRFSHQDGFKAYARLVSTINDIQKKFANSYNTFIGANPNAQGNNGVSTFQSNLLAQIPALQDPNVNVVVFNSQAAKQTAENDAQQNAPQFDKNAPTLDLGKMTPVRYVFKDDFNIKYKQCGMIRCSDKDNGTLSGILGLPPGSVGYMDLDKNQPDLLYLDSAKNTLGAGAIVHIQVPLIGVGNTSVQSESAAYVVMTAGAIHPDTTGRFSPTYWVKLGKPL